MNGTIILLQARLNSKRLNKKALLNIKKIPFIVLSSKRLSNTGIKLKVVTSNNKNDDKLVEVLKKNKISYFRGSKKNVLGRMVNSLTKYDDSTIVVRATSDNIIPDGNLIEEMIIEMKKRKVPYLNCDTLKSGLPYGLGVELIKLKELRKRNKYNNSSNEKEHVTTIIKKKYSGNKYIFDNYSFLNLSHIRCTVDYKEDFLKIIKLFERVNDPINFTWKQFGNKILINNTINKKISKFIIGGAQFGLQYGIRNRKIDFKTMSKIINKANRIGIKIIDTAQNYNDSELKVGKVLDGIKQNKLKVISKFKIHKYKNREKNENIINQSIAKTLKNINKKKIYAMLFHHSSDIFINNKSFLKTELKNSKFKKIGVSIYDPIEIYKVIKIPQIQVIQIPFNILDFRWQEHIKRIQSIKHDLGIEIHARSCFLQGLLLSTRIKDWEKRGIMQHKKILKWLTNQTSTIRRQSIADLCLAYVRSQSWIDSVVIGVDNMKELNENIKLFKLPILNIDDLKKIELSRPRVKENILNPTTWSN